MNDKFANISAVLAFHRQQSKKLDYRHGKIQAVKRTREELERACNAGDSMNRIGVLFTTQRNLQREFDHMMKQNSSRDDVVLFAAYLTRNGGRTIKEFFEYISFNGSLQHTFNPSFSGSFTAKHTKVSFNAVMRDAMGFYESGKDSSGNGAVVWKIDFDKYNRLCKTVNQKFGRLDFDVLEMHIREENRHILEADCAAIAKATGVRMSELTYENVKDYLANVPTLVGIVE